MKKIQLSLDLGSTTGWAVLANGFIQSGSEIFERKKGRKTIPDDHPGKKFYDFHCWLNGLVRLWKPEIIYFEEILSYQNNSTNQLLFGFRAVLHVVAARRGIPVESVWPTTLKVKVAGKGNATKKEMLDLALRTLSPEVTDHNESDALLILSYFNGTDTSTWLHEKQIEDIENAFKT